MYILIGAGGYLGTYLIKNLLALTDEPILAVARHPLAGYGGARVSWASCDISDAGQTQALCARYLNGDAGQGARKVIYLAAYHHPDLVAQNPRLAWDVNVTSLSRFLNMAQGVDRLVYPSSDSVYGESAGGQRFTESAPLAPVNPYGVQKSCAEFLVMAYGYHVVRYPFLIGPSLVPGKKHFCDVIVETLKAGREMPMFCDSYRSALDFDTAARLLIATMERPAGRIPQALNICGDEALSKYDIGLRIADTLGAPRALIKKISIHEDNDIFPTRRASSSLMDNSLLKQALGLPEVKLDLSALRA